MHTFTLFVWVVATLLFMYLIVFIISYLISLSIYYSNSSLVCFQSRVPVILSHWGSGTSFKNFVHFGQVDQFHIFSVVLNMSILLITHLAYRYYQ